MGVEEPRMLDASDWIVVSTGDGRFMLSAREFPPGMRHWVMVDLSNSSQQLPGPHDPNVVLVDIVDGASV